MTLPFTLDVRAGYETWSHDYYDETVDEALDLALLAELDAWAGRRPGMAKHAGRPVRFVLVWRAPA